jgi:hypothetical protein
MITRLFVKKRATARLKSRTDVGAEILEAVRTGDKFRNMIDGLTNELQKAARIVETRRGKPLKVSSLELTIDDFTDVLINSVKNEGIIRTESDLDRRIREKKVQDQKDIENTIEGNSTGVYEELGVEVEDNRDEFAEDLREQEKNK